MTWLDLVPKPRPRPEPLSPFGDPPLHWDVFLSYRSTNRYWAIALYDQLVLAGFKVFLDQFVLRPGVDLTVSLVDALNQSAAGVLVLSEDVEGATWVENEYRKMKALQDARKSTDLPFNYVIARIDKTKLPFTEQDALYSDFSDGYEDGPRGPELVRLIHGLVGVPVSDRGVRELLKMDETTKELLIDCAAYAKIGNLDKLVTVAQSERPELKESPTIAITAAQALISAKDPARALTVIESAQKTFPRSVRLRQLQGLALRRMKRTEEAQEVLAKLYAAGHRDPETLGIYAATWWLRYEATHDRSNLERSRDLYLEAFQLSPKDEYTGINAASKSALLGELATARTLAERVGKLVSQHANGFDFYRAFSLAEACVLIGRYEDAARIYKAGRQNNPERAGDIEGTLVQLEALILALKVPEEAASSLRDALQAKVPAGPT